MNCVEKDVSARLKEHYKGVRNMIIGRTAHITDVQKHQADLGRNNCQFRNKCWLGARLAVTSARSLPRCRPRNKRVI